MEFLLSATLSAIRYITGWARPTELDNVRAHSVVVFEHTSRWDFLVLLIAKASCTKVDIRTIVKPQLFDGFSGIMLGPILTALGCIAAPRLENRGTGSVNRLVEALQKLESHADKPIVLALSPKGTIQKAPWRTGYLALARCLDWDLRGAVVCFEKRRIGLGPPVDIHETPAYVEANLKRTMQLGVPLRPERSDLLCPHYDSFELLAAIDLPLATLLAFLWPLALWGHSFLERALQALCACALATAVAYHGSRETILAVPDSTMSKLTASLVLAWAAVYNVSGFLDGVPKLFVALAAYAAGRGRLANPKRGRYVVWHSAFHILAAWAMSFVIARPRCI